MMSLTRLAACVALVCLVTACNSLDGRFPGSGPGTDLVPADSAEATRLEDLYVAHLCRRAGLASPSDDGALCAPLPISQGQWSAIVQAGLNDIDARCDAYLAWLDERRRASEPILREISDLRTATAAIMSVTGAGVGPIAIAAAAFGLATNSFANLNSRLLFDLDHSTVQTVVLSRQNEFRAALPRAIDNRPAAIYALRSYLRLCMPMTIETQVNTTVKLFERGGAAALGRSQDAPIVDPRLVRSAVVRSAVRPIESPPPVRKITSATRLGPYEQSLDAAEIERFQRAVCVPATGDLGPLGSPTRLAIKEALGASDETLTDRKGVLLRRRLRDGVAC